MTNKDSKSDLNLLEMECNQFMDEFSDYSRLHIRFIDSQLFNFAKHLILFRAIVKSRGDGDLGWYYRQADEAINHFVSVCSTNIPEVNGRLRLFLSEKALFTKYIEEDLITDGVTP